MGRDEIRAEWLEVCDAIAEISDESIIKEFEGNPREAKSISQAINRLIKAHLVAKGWLSESFIFADREYAEQARGVWRLDFTKRHLCVEVAFNHRSDIAWNMLKPTLASELNHVLKAVQAEGVKEPRLCLFENVDRLLKSPAGQRGRDFAIMLSCLNSLGYGVEWRVVNSAEYGFPQRRKRVFIYAEKDADWDVSERLMDGVMASAFPIEESVDPQEFGIAHDPYEITQSWESYKVSPFLESGCCKSFHVATSHIKEAYVGDRRVLGDVLVDASDVPDEYWVPDEQLPRWEYLKGAKREERVAKNGHRYWYTEGSMAYPDLLTNPSRTILTGEGGRGASRFKHIIVQDGRYRRLVPDELDQLQGFPAGWTNVGMTDGQRAFCMGNALVVGVVHRIGMEIARRNGN